MADPRNFILDSDYPMDKIVYIGSYTVPPASPPNYFTVDHGLGVLPLVIAVASNDNWQTTIPLPAFDIGLDVYFDDTRIMVVNLTMESYAVKVFGLTIESNNSNFSATSDLAQTYILNTNYDYLKLLMSGEFQFDPTGAKTIQHNLGYTPTVLAWEEVDLSAIGMGNMYSAITNSRYLIGNHPSPTPVFESERRGIVLDNTRMIVYGVENTKCYYRIYGDAS